MEFWAGGFIWLWILSLTILVDLTQVFLTHSLFLFQTIHQYFFRCQREQRYAFSLVLERETVGTAADLHIMMKQPGSPQQQLACLHWHHVTFHLILILPNRKLNGNHVTYSQRSTIIKPLHLVGTWVSSLFQSQPLH